MKFNFIKNLFIYCLKVVILYSLVNAASVKLENSNSISYTTSKKSETNNNLSKLSINKKNFLNSKAKLEAIKNEILKNLNEFEKLNKIIFDFEDVETSTNISITNITKEIDLNQTDDFNDTIVINQNFCNLKKLKQNKLDRERNQNITNIDKNFSVSHNNTITLDLNSNSTTKKNHTIKINALKNNKNKTYSTINKDLNSTDSNNSITSDDLLNLIADQTESIKNEICTNCLEINSALNVLIDEIKNIKAQLKQFTSDKLTKKEIYEKLSYCINNINLIKADLFKLNEILDTLQKANCSNFIDNSKKYTLVVNSTNKLVEIIQDVMRRLNININLVVLN